MESPNPSDRVYLIRHATCGAAGTLLGSADPSLTSEGRAESAELARLLRGEAIERLVCSGLRRARETAGIVAAELNLEVEVDLRLNEITYGPWDGLTWAEIESRFPDAAASKLSDWFHFTPEGAEPFTEFFERIKRVWDSLPAARATPTAIVAHRTVNAVLLALSANPGLSSGDLRAAAAGPIYQFEQPHASYIVAANSTSRQGPRA